MEKEVIHTKIWQEEPEADNPFAAAKSYCSGYDVYGEILESSTWAEYVYLLVYTNLYVGVDKSEHV